MPVAKQSPREKLAEYRRKRDFSRTAEPSGSEASAASSDAFALALLGRIRDALGSRSGAIALHTGGGVRDLSDVTALARAGAASAVVGRALAAGVFTIAEAKAAAA